MTTSTQRILADLAQRAGLDDEASSLLWGAVAGDHVLGLAIDGEKVEPDPSGSSTATSPAVWLSSISVEGFRGIGSKAELLLNPQPGLTLVVGRNGSGKSSFAEGLEALLTGDNLRWRGRPVQWRQGWRNLHHDGPTAVAAELCLEGRETMLELARSWSDSFERSTLTGRCGDEEVDIDRDLGWVGALTNYKPLLSYNELGSMLEDKPSAIYDSVATVLGLDQITEARDRLRKARLEAEKPAKDTTRHRQDLTAALATSADQRAVEAASLLAARTVDLDRLDALAASSAAAETGTLATLSQLPPIDAQRCDELAAQLTAAAAQRRDAAVATDGNRADRLAKLLRQALDHHDHEGVGPCPVCRVGSLDGDWRQQAEAEAAGLEQTAAGIRRLDEQVRQARRDAVAGLVPPPASLAALPHDDLDDLAVAALAGEARALHERWLRLVEVPAGEPDVDDLVERLSTAAELSGAVERIRAEATKLLAAQDADWRPLGRQISAWVAEAIEADTSTRLAKRLGKVEAFLKDAEATLRTERFRPIADASAALWAQLRQQSNVSLERVALQGRANTRRVDLDVTVDGTQTSALGVMSQGELHALALALFLPRVTTTDSPFRFLVVDDPVQAMDPARVDGLAQVLTGVAAERQVIVLTHDDRLPAACRRLGIPADVIEVSRQTGSRVTASVSTSPAEKAIGDAYSLARTERLPEPLKRQIVPIHCRRALEAHARDLAWRRLLPGRTHDQVERLLDEADTTVELLSVLLFGEVRSDRKAVYDRLDELQAGSAGKLRFLNKAVHEPQADLRPEDLTRSVRDLMAALRDWAA